MKRTPLQSIVVVRDGKSMSPPIGAAFDFTAEEVEQIEAMSPGAISEETVVNLDKQEKADAKKAAAKDGKKEDL